MRRLRERRQRGARIIHVEVDLDLIELLTARGLLLAEEAEDDAALSFALAQVFERILKKNG